jgi:hypothetical protein
MSSERLRLAAQTIRAAASGDVTPGPWKVIEEHGRDIADEGWSFIAVASADGTEVAATAFPGGPDDAVDPLGDAAHIALWSPTLALAVAAWLDYAAQVQDRRESAGAAPYVQALAVADAVLERSATPAAQ